ncbi:MAG: hypothetical protein GTN89_11035 [Acidobacteria bacterium]|nr:hypothetical protein [Acidobacteriota bacterium]NIM62144.1 hypothetical protein [Acidobacteriota bacterium]NIO59798.1 hypothetical protein [Acidobacteriota bacterium]NIQ30881.1 hypothetical protein [Acidobacteriota bacterium]NIQ85954.1 hypothetical protein [Acidobacteriota bacterium]
MFIDINDIGEGSLEFDQTLTLTRVRDDNPDLLEPPNVRVRGTITAGPTRGRPAEGASLDGRLEGPLRLRCCRCLEPFEQPVEAEFHLTLRSEAPEVEDPDHRIDTSETGFFEIEEGQVELDAVATEQVFLNLPQKPLCSGSCAGLCPTCGINRNRLECDCREETVDPRLQALRRIRDEMDPPRGRKRSRNES